MVDIADSVVRGDHIGLEVYYAKLGVSLAEINPARVRRQRLLELIDELRAVSYVAAVTYDDGKGIAFPKFLSKQLRIAIYYWARERRREHRTASATALAAKSVRSKHEITADIQDLLLKLSPDSREVFNRICQSGKLDDLGRLLRGRKSKMVLHNRFGVSSKEFMKLKDELEAFGYGV